MGIGSPRSITNVSDEYNRIAAEDEDTANYLATSGRYRHALLFLIQAMEKLIRAKTFSIINPTLAALRDINRSHSLDNAVDVLVQVISTQDIVREQLRSQLQQHVLGGIRYNHLHNDLRYPSWEAQRTYSVLDVTRKDFDAMAQRLDALRKFLSDLHLLR